MDTDIKYQSFQTEPALVHTQLCKQLLQPLQVFANNHNEEETENNEVNCLEVFSSCRNILSFLWQDLGLLALFQGISTITLKPSKDTFWT